MKIAVGQIYIEVGINFPFNHHFQIWISKQLSESAYPSTKFVSRYGEDFQLIFRMSAKTKILDTEIRGPTVYKKAKNVEYSIFLPYDVIIREGGNKISKCASALNIFLKAVVKVLKTLEIDTLKIEKEISSWVEQACSNPNMFHQDEM